MKKKTKEEFKKWLKSDNVLKIKKNNYIEQTTQWRCLFTKKEIKKFYKKEFKNI